MTGFNRFISVIIQNISFILLILAFISFIYASFLVGIVLGFVILGIILVILAYILQPTGQNGGNN